MITYERLIENGIIDSIRKFIGVLEHDETPNDGNLIVQMRCNLCLVYANTVETLLPYIFAGRNPDWWPSGALGGYIVESYETL